METNVSSSMAEEIEPQRSKHSALQALLPRFAGIKRYAFSSDCCPVQGATLPPPGGGTDMAHAFGTIKRARILQAVLITDGLPNDEQAALDAAKGLRLDILYVGPDPKPDFLDRLARACGGTATTASLKGTGQPALEQKTRQLLALPAPKGR